jgi:hypothetical protein
MMDAIDATTSSESVQISSTGIAASPFSSSDEDLHAGSLAFDIQLRPTGDEGSGFHYEDTTFAPSQGDVVIYRPSAVDIEGRCMRISHGSFRSKHEGPLRWKRKNFWTLLVFKFRFDPNRKARRIASVDIELEFSNYDSGAAGPEVFAIAPDGDFDFGETEQHVTTTNEGGGNAGAGVTAFKAEGTLHHAKVVAKTEFAASTVTGKAALRNRGYGEPNFASWNLLENPKDYQGVPRCIMTAILLKRKHNRKFRCDVSVEANADWRTELGWVFGKTPRDRPLIFDPTEMSSDEFGDESDLEKIQPLVNRYADVPPKIVLPGRKRVESFHSEVKSDS